MSGARIKLRVLLDEGAPAAVGKTFEKFGHALVPYKKVLKPGADDVLVCKAALANDAILVAFDKDMKRIAREFGIGKDRFSRLSVLKFTCPEPMASKRLELAMSFVEHEWQAADAKAARRLYVEISTHVLRSWR